MLGEWHHIDRLHLGVRGLPHGVLLGLWLMVELLELVLAVGVDDSARCWLEGWLWLLLLRHQVCVVRLEVHFVSSFFYCVALTANCV